MIWLISVCVVLSVVGLVLLRRYRRPLSVRLEIRNGMAKLRELHEDRLIQESVYSERQRELVLMYTELSGEVAELLPSRVDMRSVRKSTDVEMINNFDDMGLNDILLRGIYSFGYEYPTEIQQKTIVPISQGRDVIGQASSCTGKTAAFVIGAVNRIDFDKVVPQLIIIAPSRELAQQILRFTETMCKYLDCKIGSAIGGAPIKVCLKQFRKGVHVVIGTPGRIWQLVNSGIIETSQMKTLVLDEGDELLASPHRDCIRDIFQKNPSDIQVCVFGTTLHDDVLLVTDKFAVDPVTILVNDHQLMSSSLVGTDHFYLDLPENKKINRLIEIYENRSNIPSLIIFCQTIRKVNKVSRRMTFAGYNVAAYHAKVSTAERETVMERFRNGIDRVLITTDLLGRGIDIHDVTHVINFDYPSIEENYINRAGRTGRYLRKGTVISFTVNREKNKLEALAEKYNISISTYQYPRSKDK